MMHSPSELSPTGQVVSETSSLFAEDAQGTSSAIRGKADIPRFLITLDGGIGDTVLAGLSAIDQIIKDDPVAYGKIDILCNPLQAEVFEYDPRINKIIQTDKIFYPGRHITQWLRGIVLDAGAARLIHFLRSRRYEAVLPSMVAPGLYFRLHSHLMYPDPSKLVKNLLTLRAPSDVPLRKSIRQIVNRYFRKDIPSSALTDELLLHLDASHIQKAMGAVEQMKKMSNVNAEDAKVLLVATDSASVVTRPPTHLLASALSDVLHTYRHLIAGILPSYTDALASGDLRAALASDFADRVFALPAEPRPTPLDTAALIDQADIFVTGDTGVMHLAVATKSMRQGAVASFAPRNSVKIIAIFGGTNPDLYGYKERTLIVGRGRKEQRAISPGWVKEWYNPKGKDLFDHITPQQLAEAIMSQMPSKRTASRAGGKTSDECPFIG